MKTLRKLFISPTPWRAKKTITLSAHVCDGYGGMVYPWLADNSRLIAAAPDLYEALREIIDGYECKDCAYLHDGVCTRPASKSPECLYKRSRKALEKAGGAE